MQWYISSVTPAVPSTPYHMQLQPRSALYHTTHCLCFLWLQPDMAAVCALQDCGDGVERGPEAAHPPGLLAPQPGCRAHQ